MNSFALLWGKILDSSLWINGTKEARLTWIAILAMKNSEGIVYASIVGLADRAKVTVDECKAALLFFLSPDPDDTSKVDDGRRLREVPGGWQVINHDLYRFSTEAKREFWRQTKAAQRAQEKETKAKRAKKIKRGLPLPGEAAHERAVNEGREEDAQHIADHQPGIE